MAGGIGLPDDIKALYGFRHGFATHHTMSGTPLPVVSGMLGHKRLAQMDAYSHFSPDAAAKWQEEAFSETTRDDIRKENERFKEENEALRSENEALQAEVGRLQLVLSDHAEAV